MQPSAACVRYKHYGVVVVAGGGGGGGGSTLVQVPVRAVFSQPLAQDAFAASPSLSLQSTGAFSSPDSLAQAEPLPASDTS